MLNIQIYYGNRTNFVVVTRITPYHPHLLSILSINLLYSITILHPATTDILEAKHSHVPVILKLVSSALSRVDLCLSGQA